MSHIEIWSFIHEKLAVHAQCALLVVVHSKGSSPGRQGFKMVVGPDGDMIGSIGGGIMEHKLVAYTHSQMATKEHFWEMRRQVHSKDAERDQSGMICSGEQTIALLHLKSSDISKVETILTVLRAQGPLKITFCHDGWDAIAPGPGDLPAAFQTGASGQWSYAEMPGARPVAHVVGAGHVGLATCRVLQMLDFFVINYDDRPGLNTMEANEFADKKIVSPYPEIGNHIHADENAFVIVMTFGYRGDDEVIRALLGRKFRYFGMMGSQAKVAKLLTDLRRDGYDEAAIQTLRTPAGLVAHCKTPTEIAISIAAEMISIRNNK